MVFFVVDKGCNLFVEYGKERKGFVGFCIEVFIVEILKERVGLVRWVFFFFSCLSSF